MQRLKRAVMRPGLANRAGCAGRARFVVSHDGSGVRAALGGKRGFKRLDAVAQLVEVAHERGAPVPFAVVDGRVGWTGSLNLIEPGYHRAKSHRLGREWVELMVRVEGPVVASLNAVFASDWYAETAEDVDHGLAPSTGGEQVVREPGEIACQVVPSGPGLAVENNLRMFTSLLVTDDRRFFSAELQSRLDEFLSCRSLFSPELMALADKAIADRGLDEEDAQTFLKLATAAFELESALLCDAKPPEKAEAHALLAREKLALGDAAAARQHRDEALRLDPSNADAHALKL